MKFIYFGSSEYSHITLADLYHNGFIPSLIVSQPDKPKGRGLKVIPTEVSLFAIENDIPLIRPSTLKSESVKEHLKKEEPDFIVVADYGKKIPSWILSLPKQLPLASHPSLLPLYRGAAPVHWAIVNGEEKTGVTVFKVNDKVDAGEIIIQKEIGIEDNHDIISLTDILPTVMYLPQ